MARDEEEGMLLAPCVALQVRGLCPCFCPFVFLPSGLLSRLFLAFR